MDFFHDNSLSSKNELHQCTLNIKFEEYLDD